MASSGAELTPRAREIVETARALLEEEGPEAVSMRRIADRLGIRAPSLYKHLADKAALFEAAVREPDPLAAIATVYRRFAREHPHLYRLMTERPLARERLTPG